MFLDYLQSDPGSGAMFADYLQSGPGPGAMWREKTPKESLISYEVNEERSSFFGQLSSCSFSASLPFSVDSSRWHLPEKTPNFSGSCLRSVCSHRPTHWNSLSSRCHRKLPELFGQLLGHHLLGQLWVQTHRNFRAVVFGQLWNFFGELFFRAVSVVPFFPQQSCSQREVISSMERTLRSN